MTVYMFLILGVFATFVSGEMGAGSSVVIGVDAGCLFLELHEGEGWWCCGNRTLSVHQFVVVGAAAWGNGPMCPVFIECHRTARHDWGRRTVEFI